MVGITLLEPLLAALPTCLQCMRIGPLASPGRYSARDWFISNTLCIYCALLFFILNYKYVAVCGWSPDELPWTLERYPNWNQPGRGCDYYSVNAFDGMVPSLSTDVGSLGGFIGVCIGLCLPLLVGCVARKLPGWGEPPAASDASKSPAAGNKVADATAAVEA